MFNFKRNGTSIGPMTYKLGGVTLLVPTLFLLAGTFSIGVLVTTIIFGVLTVVSAWFDSETNN